MFIAWVIKGILWVGKIAVENFVTEYAKKQASKIKHKLKNKNKNDNTSSINNTP